MTTAKEVTNDVWRFSFLPYFSRIHYTNIYGTFSFYARCYSISYSSYIKYEKLRRFIGSFTTKLSNHSQALNVFDIDIFSTSHLHNCNLLVILNYIQAGNCSIKHNP